MTKYNAKKTVIDEITFDSKAEGEYYLILKEKLAKGEIIDLDIQPCFILQEAFEKDGKKYRAIKYIADFEVMCPGEKVEIIDIKGFETPEFKIKRKLFENIYPHYSLTLLKYVIKFGGWIELDEWKRLKKAEKKVSK
jgi:hypothetical protein